jgi:hypothetical protein
MGAMTSLVAIDYAETYAASRPGADSWLRASDDDKANALRFASILIRALPFTVDFRTIEHSELLMVAACEWAIDILRNPHSLNSATSAIQEKEVGDLRVKYTVAGQDFVPVMVRVYLDAYIAPAASGRISHR